jgi:hypothetical protein
MDEVKDDGGFFTIQGTDIDVFEGCADAGRH